MVSLKRPDDYNPKDGAVFQIHFEKARGFVGEDAEGFESQLIMNNGKPEWKVRPIQKSSYDQVVTLASQGFKQKEIAEQLELNKSNVSRHLKRANQEGKVIARSQLC